jgi:hypothetical protein
VQSLVFDLHAAIGDDVNSLRFRAGFCVGIGDLKLEPEHGHVIAGKGFLDDSRHFLARTKNVDDVYLLCYFRKRVVGGFTEDFFCVGIDRNYVIPMFSEVVWNLVGVLSRGGRTADDGDGAKAEEFTQLGIALDWHEYDKETVMNNVSVSG